MSQAKVDKYKNYKKNRRENIQKEKRKALLMKCAAWAVVVLIIAGVAAAIGVSIYNTHQAKLAAMPTYGSDSFVLSDYAGIQQEESDLKADEEEIGTEAESEEAESVAETVSETEAAESEEETSEPETKNE